MDSDSIPVAKEEVPPQYEHYLHLLQERNRLIKKLRQKDRKEIELEKKEKGFTVYLNSSFSVDKDSRSKFDTNRQLHRRKTVNAADQIVSSNLTRSKLEPASQAPDKRRHWNISSVEFTAADGQRHKVKPPEILTGNYNEDFEDEAEFESKMSSLDLNDWDNVDSVNNSSSLTTPRKHKTSYLKRVVAAKREESETENTVVIKMEDVKKLRESLQKNKKIRQSIAMDSDSIPVAKEEVPPQYEHYLHLLQERNRLIKKLRQKDRKEIELEKKEKGFTVYLNSSFSVDKDSRSKFDTNRQLHRRKTVNAADQIVSSNLTRSKLEPASQAPDKRRHWNISSVEFTAADGQRHKVKPPEILTGNYNEDFEDEAEFESKMSSLDLNDWDNVDSVNNSSSLTTPRKHKTSYLKRVVAAKREESETENTVVIKMEDVKKLRESLQKNKKIRQSIAMDSDSDDDPSEKSSQNESDGERISPIDEEIEEVLSSDDENKKAGSGLIKPLKLFKPGDTLVLEFQPLTNKTKPSTNLTAARKKTDTEISSSISSVKSWQLSSITSTQKSLTPREFTVRSETSKASRPLSANRKSTDTKTDTQDEAAAVVKALLEENKKVEKSKSRPLPQPKKSASLAVLPTNSAQDQMPSLNQSTTQSDKPKDEPEPSIDCVIKKVLQMNPKQQRQLLNTLNHIDTEDQLVSSHCITSSWSSKGPVTERMEVTFEILSNWGHPSMVGLTELQFFDQSKCLIPIKPSDVSIHGAKENSNNIEVLFNGKSKTTKERNMWCCRFDRRPIEFSILLINPNPGKNFQLGSVKVWNWNNKINNLDIGARHIRIFFKEDLLFDGEIDKGCGNQVFDYSKQIVFSLFHSVHQSQSGKSPSKSMLSLDLSKSGGNSVLVSKNSPRLASPASESPTKIDIYGLNPSGSHHTFRSISRSSQSSASSSGSTKASAQCDEKMEEGAIRSETRTLLRATVLPGLSSPEINTTDCLGNVKMPEKSRAQTPKKSKRVAANLNGRSNDTDNSFKSNHDSYESKPPLPPTSKSDDKQSSSSSSRSLERSSISSTKTKMSPKSSRSEPHISPSTPSPSSSQVNNSIHLDKKDSNLLNSIKTMNQSENKRKKTIPTWLKGDRPVENVAEKFQPQELYSKRDKHKEEADIQKELDEEFERFSQSGCKNKEKGSSNTEENDVLSPMKKIEKTRAKWRLKETDLEESWGSLSFFNKSHRGRVSIDMGDNELDEYLKPEVKSTEIEPPAAAPKIHLANDSWSDDDTDFTIPELPGGKEMVINIKTTWGDHHYVGLTGIQLFSSQGEQVIISKIWANPSDINILPEYNRDPRVVTNLIDNINRTRDDVHMWLAPFTSGKDHFIYLTFSKPCKLALMRIWNYNKSRIHSFRGAKDVIITLDGVTIFKGEIARACGGIEGGTEAFGDTILFTTDDDILEAVSKNDDAFEGEIFSENDEDLPEMRPATADADDDTRPFTRAAGQIHKETNRGTSTSRPASSFVTNIGDVLVYKTIKLQLQFTATWGDYHYLGLTGLELVGSDGEAIPISLDMITALPKDLRHLPGNEKDERTLDKLLDGTNVTCHDSHMWLIPFTDGQNHMITVSFSQPALLSGLRVWNYNKSPEDTYRGAKLMHVYINDKIVSPSEGYLLRKGPGVCHFDFAQEITFSNSSNLDNTPAYQINEGGILMPRGFIFQFQLFNTWGDQYYIGLNGLEFYDASFNKIELTQTNIAAYPDSVNVLDNITNDARTPDKLIDGFNDTNDGRHMWLAPILPSIINRIYIIFDQPTSVSMIKLWNYSKTVARGVKDFALLVDDLLVYNGTLQAISGGAKGIVPNCSAPIPHHTILFSDNKDVTLKEKHFIISNQTEDQDIQLMNDKKVISQVTNASSSKPVNQALRPKTSVTKTSR